MQLTEEQKKKMEDDMVAQLQFVAKKLGLPERTREELLSIHEQIGKFTFFLLSFPSAASALNGK